MEHKSSFIDLLQIGPKFFTGILHSKNIADFNVKIHIVSVSKFSLQFRLYWAGFL